MNLEQVGRNWVAGWNSRDSEAFSRLYAPDGMYADPSFGIRRVGRTLVRMHHQISWCMRTKVRPTRRMPNDGSAYMPSGAYRREKASESREFHPATQLRPTCSKFILLLLLRCQ